MLIIGLILQSAFLFAFFLSLHTVMPFWVFLGMMAVLNFGQAAIVGVVPAYYSEMFRTDVRVTGISVGMQLGALAGGFTPFVATWIIAEGGSWPTLAIISAAVSAIAAIGVVVLRRRAVDPLGEDVRDDAAGAVTQGAERL
ncbi:MFS transporter [Microbacterium suwonense]|uniref:Major facilitator superfamily (MFS) profile domain-containing protein n=1 Tax=Microbacterium suwonense TaxID=683047 RepID=A0ABN6X3M7_9MICO|nr:MFS transporter [Microbacterium suwonense]BDZ39311.1 hypothetical protein GCM10025863_19250 [Microbacterium suwonense]